VPPSPPAALASPALPDALAPELPATLGRAPPALPPVVAPTLGSPPAVVSAAVPAVGVAALGQVSPASKQVCVVEQHV
jgi:hypothetical protein